MHREQVGYASITSKPPRPGERHGIDSPSQLSEGSNPAHTLISDSRPQNCKTIRFCHLSHCLWDFATAALAN